jgi:hypothetical protein
MNITTIILQVPENASEPVSTVTIILFWSVVLICVAAFFYFLKRTDRIIEEEARANNTPPEVDNKRLSHHDVHEEEAAAIALAIHMYKSEMHDMDSFTITLRKVSRIYSPWSSKIYTLRQNPR